MPGLSETWNQFFAERSISLSPSSICTDYAQTTKWLNRCPIQDLDQGRQVIIWILGQKPIKSARRVCMFTRSMYRWASSEDVGISRWLETGIPVTQAAAWAGNTSEVIWKHYAGVTQKFEMPNL
jgi:hypothetical protein